MPYQDNTNHRYSGVKKLEITEVGMPNYNNDIVRKIYRGFEVGEIKSESNPRILDFGAGIGTLALIFRKAYQLEVHCLEIDPIQRTALNKNGLETFSKLQDLRLYKYIYTSNVLEHIEDDVKTLKELYSHLESKGILVVYVPALPFLYSVFDSSVGHYRRYSKKDLETKIQMAGFKIHKSDYCDSLGIIGNLLIKIFGNEEKISSSKSLLNFYDSNLYSFSKLLDLLFRKIIGKNILVVAKKE
jgi:SAM-dependent methyltransferase